MGAELSPSVALLVGAGLVPVLRGRWRQLAILLTPLAAAASNAATSCRHRSSSTPLG